MSSFVTSKNYIYKRFHIYYVHTKKHSNLKQIFKGTDMEENIYIF